MREPRLPKYTREELYEMVWSQSLRSLAPRLGISVKGLAKLCDRHEIPRPPHGYWRKLECGKEVEEQPPLLPASKEWRETIWRPDQPVEDTPVSVHGHPIHNRDIAKQIRWERDSCCDPCDYELPRLKKHRLQIGDVSKFARKRARKIADMYTRACVQRGYPIEGNVMEVFGEKIQFRLFEADISPDSGDDPRHEPDMRLIVTLEAGDRRRKFTDTRRRRLENRLREVMIGAQYLADSVAEERRKEERRRLEEQKRQEELERQRLERKRRRAKKAWLDRLGDQFLKAAEDWRFATNARVFMKACVAEARKRGIAVEGDGEFAKWLAASREGVDKVDPLKGANAFDQFRMSMPQEFLESFEDKGHSWEDCRF